MLRRLAHYWRILGPRGAMAAVAGKVAGPRLLPVRSAEAKHPVLLRVPSTDIDAYCQIFLEAQYQFEVKAPPRVIVDAGANVGLAAVYFANRFPSARILAIECEPSNFELLRRNAEPYRNIVPIHAALWDSDGEIEILNPGLGQWGFMTATRGATASGVSCVRSTTLESLRRAHDIDRIDILKIDIEGAELEVFNASAPWIGDVDAIIAELHDRLKPGCESAFEQATHGFEWRWRQGEHVFVTRAESCLSTRG